MSATPSNAIALAPAMPIENQRNLITLLDRQREELIKALSGTLKPEYFTRVALTAFRKQPLLLKCTTESVMVSLLDLAQLGLTANGTVGEAWLIPFRNGDRYEAQLVIGYKGYAKLIRRANAVRNLHADIVDESDYFEVEYGSNRRLVHRPNLKSQRNDPTNWKGAYAYLALEGGGEEFVFVGRDRIKKIQAASKGGSRGPWVDWPDAMWSKSAVLQLKKLVSLNPDEEEVIERAMRVDDLGSIDVQATVDPTPEGSGLVDRPSEAKRIPTRTRKSAPAAAEPGPETAPQDAATPPDEARPEGADDLFGEGQ
jgi:recombination protein RecT